MQLKPEISRGALKEMMAAQISQRKLHHFKSPAHAKAWAQHVNELTPQLLEAAADVRWFAGELQRHRARYYHISQKMIKLRTSVSPSMDIEEVHLRSARGREIILRCCEREQETVSKVIQAVEARLTLERKRLKELGEEYEKPEPIVTSWEMNSKVFKEEEKVENRKDGCVLKGTEYIGTLATPGISPGPGGSLFAWPLSPAAFGGSRLQAFSQMYDMFKIVSMFFEYTPMVPSTTGGAVCGYTVPDIMDDPCSTRSGEVVTRDAVSRDGAEVNQVFKPAVYGIALPQQAIYFTTNQENPNLMFAGLFSLLEVNALPVSTTVGMITCHYEIEFVSASSVRFTGQASRTFADATPNWSGLTETINKSFFVDPLQWSTPVLAPGEVGEAVVTAFNDGPNPPAWRTLLAGDDRKPVTLQAGTRLWFRLDATAAHYLFFPSLGAAIIGHDSDTDPGTPSDAYVNSVTTAVVNPATLSLAMGRVWMIPGSTL